MHKLIWLVIGILFISTHGEAVDGMDAKEIKDSEEIAVAVMINKTSDFISQRIMSCVDGGQEQQTCICLSKELIQTHSKLIQQSLEDYPHWVEMEWIKFEDASGEMLSINAKGLQRESEIKLGCE